jgi:hypothetical protein
MNWSRIYDFDEIESYEKQWETFHKTRQAWILYIQIMENLTYVT